ncbi:hypothetical protein [Falsarthrobacter nasiphocae]|uniref:Secreted protein n=1 Tax=Falsarthrobacter nasiphocae TaxID=189863 RepID=A0AAE3YFL2_9MICC|nr:hypothetical protein [Falsarthrobacter nasiphocae]MDR6891812.1 hypothetical protein [Falsarthrobacter nasiphocae]
MTNHSHLSSERARRPRARLSTAGPALLAAALLAGCASPSPSPETTAGAPASDSPSAPQSASHGPSQSPSQGAAASTDAHAKDAGNGHGTEVAAPVPRLVATYDGGVLTLDATTLEQVADEKIPGFLRVNPAGDGRHAFLSTDKGFRLFDAGTWSEAHGDHSHSYTADPKATSATVAADHPGHVVVHGGRTALFADGTGTVSLLETDAIAKGAEAGSLRPVGSVSAPQPHHGVAVPLPDGGLAMTRSKGEERTGMSVYAKDLKTVTHSSDDCPGTHGEAVAKGGAVVFGCENGVLIYTKGAIKKVASPDKIGRIGNQAGSEASPIVLGDYKVRPSEGTREHPTRVSLIDTRTGTIRLVDVKASYTFRSLGRGPAGEALVLGTDGKLRVLDPATGRITKEIRVTDAWTEPEEWQKPRPALHVQGATAYVTDPATRRLVSVDIPSGEIVKETTTTQPINEITSVTGKAARAPHSH